MVIAVERRSHHVLCAARSSHAFEAPCCCLLAIEGETGPRARVIASLQLLAAVKEFATDMRLDPALARRAQETIQLQFHRNGGTHLSTLLNTPEVSRNIREDVLMYVYGPALQVRVHECPHA